MSGQEPTGEDLARVEKLLASMNSHVEYAKEMLPEEMADEAVAVHGALTRVLAHIQSLEGERDRLRALLSEIARAHNGAMVAYSRQQWPAQRGWLAARAVPVLREMRKAMWCDRWGLPSAAGIRDALDLAIAALEDPASSAHQQQEIERLREAVVKEIAEWLRHIDRLDEIPGARYPGLEKNPLWDASFALEEKFGGASQGDER